MHILLVTMMGPFTSFVRTTTIVDVKKVKEAPASN
jgi:hypothetical protein